MSDGRWPTGGHAHSGGLEPAVRSGLVTDARTLEKWLRGRLRTTGEVDACFAAVAWALAESVGSTAWDSLIDEYWARVPVPSLREASRVLGRAVLRAAEATWPAGSRLTGSPWPLAFAAAARAGGVDLQSTTLAIATASVQGPAWSATRLMGLDPYQVAGCLSRLAAEIEEVAHRAGGCDPETLPSLSAPLLDIGVGHHSTWEVRLFAS
jgi:urease accessory protein